MRQSPCLAISWTFNCRSRIWVTRNLIKSLPLFYVPWHVLSQSSIGILLVRLLKARTLPICDERVSTHDKHSVDLEYIPSTTNTSTHVSQPLPSFPFPYLPNQTRLTTPNQSNPTAPSTTLYKYPTRHTSQQPQVSTAGYSSISECPSDARRYSQRAPCPSAKQNDNVVARRPGCLVSIGGRRRRAARQSRGALFGRRGVGGWRAGLWCRPLKFVSN